MVKTAATPPIHVTIPPQPAVADVPQGIQITIKQPDVVTASASDGPWVWLDVHPERGVQLYTTLKGTQLERRDLEFLSKVVTYLLEAKEVTLAGARQALGE